VKSVKVNGWKIYFHPLFNEQYLELRNKVSKLKQKLSDEEYKNHSDVKFFGKLYKIIYQIIPDEPFAHYFVLKGELKRYSRVKGKGLPDRYRLFFLVLKEKAAIIILWLGYPRKQGAKDDCYEVFIKMILRSEFPTSFVELKSLIPELQDEEVDIIPLLDEQTDV
jgi:toxin YhaV